MITSLGTKLKFYSLSNFEQLAPLNKLSHADREAMRVVAHVLPFRTNNYVVEQLIDWERVPDDPLFQLTFPQPGMLRPDHFQRMEAAVRGNTTDVRTVAADIQRELNPHPEGQLVYNAAMLDDQPVPGVQHKYGETVLIFPSAGQTCHAYCSFCFRWAQFIGASHLKMATDESMRFSQYVGSHREVTDVLLTGGDPMIMRADVLARYIEPLLQHPCSHVQTIRLGTKSLAYWPYRFLTDGDTDDLLRLLERIVASGKHLSIMAHFSHPHELGTEVVRRAISRLRGTGAVIRTQSPVIRHINDDATVWARMWQAQVQLGCVPYYMFVERDTGAQHYFKVPIYRVLEIYRNAIQRVSGLARTARGPVMSALPGKVLVEGVADVKGQSVFVLSLIQARDATWCRRPFFAQLDLEACWLTDLRPAGGEPHFFYESALLELLRQRREPSVGSIVPRELVAASVPAPAGDFGAPFPMKELPNDLVTTSA